MSSISETNSSLIMATHILTYYGYPFMLIMGNIGNILNIILFLRKKLRITSCNNYFLVSAFSNLMALNITIISLLYSDSHSYIITIIYCRIRGYLMNVSLQISRYLILTACFDRYTLCSTNAYLRKFAHIRIARRYAIPTIILICLIIPIHVPIYETVGNGSCTLTGIAAFYNSIYSIVFIGVIPPVLMFIFSLLTFRNLKLRQRRRQIAPVINNNRQMQARDQQVLAMLLVQVFAYVASTTPYTITAFYLVLKTNHSMVALDENKSKITFILFITDMLRLFCPFISFYLFILVSRLYRQEMKSIIINIYQKFHLLWRRNNEQENIVTGTRQSPSIRPTQTQQNLATIELNVMPKQDTI